MKFCFQDLVGTKITISVIFFFWKHRNILCPLGCLLKNWHSLKRYERGLIILWLYKENNKLRNWKKCIYSTYSPLSSTHLWVRCSNFFNSSKKNYFGSANKKGQRLISTRMYFRQRVWEELIAYFLYNTDRIENDASNNSCILCVIHHRQNSIELLYCCVYIRCRGIVFLPCRCLATIRG
jgi:hypothetical protein